MRDEEAGLIFRFFNEVGIIEQLSRTMLEARLPHGFLASHFTVLNHLTRVQDGQTPLAMARAFQVPKTTMTHTLAGLEKAGLIEMRANPADGRSKCVWLTEAGKAFRQDAFSGLTSDMAGIAEQIGVERMAAALPLLTDIRTYLDKARD